MLERAAVIHHEFCVCLSVSQSVCLSVCVYESVLHDAFPAGRCFAKSSRTLKTDLSACSTSPGRFAGAGQQGQERLIEPR